MKFKTYVCIQEDCGEICKHESVLDGDRHPKPPSFAPTTAVRASGRGSTWQMRPINLRRT